MKLQDLKSKGFINHLINKLNGDVYVVGGYIRDFLLKKENKDIDLIVRKIDINTLISELKKFGRVDVVGKSFGVIKLKANEDGLEYDIALPRKEKPTGEGGHKGFEINSDKDIQLKDDLSRRDAKINSMAYSINRDKLIDPFGGLDDIKNKKMSITNSEAFGDDPLRMLRMIGFASRFDFTIEPKTMKMIQQNAPKIKEIAGERMLVELDKIVKKGNARTGAQLLKDTGLYKEMFGSDLKQSTIDRSPFEEVNTMGEFVFLLLKSITNTPADVFKTKLRGDVSTEKEIMALNRAFMIGDDSSNAKARAIVHNMFGLSPDSLKSKILPEKIKIAAGEFLSSKYPKSIKELAVNGNDLMNLGFKGKEIGDSLKELLINIYSDKLKNNKEDLLDFLKNPKI